MATAPSLTFVPAGDNQSADLRKQELLNFLTQESENARDVALEEDRAAAIGAYQGDKYGDEEEGRSQAITRDVAETIDWMLTGMLGTVMAGGKAVEFETEPETVPVIGPNGQPVVGQNGQPQTQQVDYGAEATAAVQYQFFRKQKGYRILHDAGKAGMLEKTGIVRTFAEPQRPQRQQRIAPGLMVQPGQNGEAQLDGLNVVDAQPADDPEHDAATAQAMQAMAAGLPAMPPPPDARLHTITVEIPQAPIIRDECVPNEWFRVSPDTVELDDSPYVGQRTPVSISKLVAMGYDYETLKTLWDDAPADTVVEQARDSERSKTRQNIVRRDDAERQLWLHSEYPLFDMDGDGIAERLFVHRIGQNILSVVPVDEQPYTGWSPIPMQHRFTGQSLYDKTGDIQRIRTVLLRNALDSVYQSVSPRTLISEDAMTADTIDDLLTVRPGALIRYKGAVTPQPFAVNDVSQVAFNAMEMMSAERDGRTGLTRQSQGMNPDSTNKTFGGLALLDANADQLELYVCRNFIEGLVAPMFLKRYRLMKAFMPPFKMKIDGQYRMVDPSKWPDDIDVKINVGLGTGAKDAKIAHLTQLVLAQSNGLEQGVPIFSPKNLYNATKQLIELGDIGVTSDYITDPDTVPPKPPQPDPAVAKAQADAQTQQAKDVQAHQQAMANLQLQQQQQDAENALKAQANAQDLQAKREKAALDNELERNKAQSQAALAVRQQEFEMDLANRRFAFDQEMARKKHAQADESDDNISTLREGGDLSQ
jgi:hypothetical protein